MYLSLIYSPLALLSFIISLTSSPVNCNLYAYRRSLEWPCEPITIANGVVKYRRRNKIAKIRCNFGYVMMGGDRKTTCILRKWRGTIPHCITAGCEDVSVTNGQAVKLYSGALVQFICNPGYQLVGSSSIFCDGEKWNATASTCTIPEEKPNHTYCNFEFRSICDWIQDHLDDFNWKRSSGVMNAVTGSLGAKRDHTLTKSYGHYLFADANENWSFSKIARIFSPIIAVPKETPSCVTLWYHMNGPNTGMLKVYVKQQTMPFEVLYPRHVITGNHGDVWNLLIIHISDLTEDYFQIVLEAQGGIGFVGDTAIDDFKVLTGPACIAVDIDQATTERQAVETNIITTEAEIPETTEQIVHYTTTLHPKTTTRRAPPSWSNVPSIKTTLQPISTSTRSSSLARSIYTFNFTIHTRPSTTSSFKATRTPSSTPSTSYSSRRSTGRQSSTTTAAIFVYTTEKPSTTSTVPNSSMVSETTDIRTTVTAFTVPGRLSFEGLGKRTVAAPILVAVLGLGTIAAVLTVYWVKRRQQTALYQYSDINTEQGETRGEEPPVQRDTSRYVQLGDDSFVHIDCE